MILTYHTLDVFTDRVFGGNPLAVFPDATGLDDDTMLRIARELNLSETVFVLPNDERTVLGDVGAARVRSNGARSAPAGSAGSTEIAPADPAPSAPPRIRVRIFTPGYEVPFAGHPTVGTAWFLAASGLAGRGAATPETAAPAEVTPSPTHLTLILEENVGPVPVRVDLDADGRPTRATLTAAEPPTERDPTLDGLDVAAISRILSLSPEDIGADAAALEIGVGVAAADPETAGASVTAAELAAALGIEPGAAPTLTPAFASIGLPFLIVPVRDVAAAGRARIDTAAWSELLPEGSWSRMICVFAPAETPATAAQAAASPPHAAPAAPTLHVRTFCPDAGVPEDPATGSANAALAGYLARRVLEGGDSAQQHPRGGNPSQPMPTAGSLAPAAKTPPTPPVTTLRWRSRQGVEMGRPSELLLEADLELEGGRIAAVRVGGAAVAVSRCEMEIPEPTRPTS